MPPRKQSCKSLLLFVGIPLCLADVLVSDPNASKVESVWIIFEELEELSVIDTDSPDAEDLSVECKAEEHKAAISEIAQGKLFSSVDICRIAAGYYCTRLHGACDVS